METDEWDRITVTKLECAERQFDTAIALWFEDGDAVAFGTLVAAAHQICHDLARADRERKEGKKIGFEVSPFIFNEELWGAQWAAFKKLVLSLEGFAKHADHKGENTPD